MSSQAEPRRKPVDRLDAAPEGDRVGRAADSFVRIFSTPWFLALQTLLIGLWILVNVVGAALRFDPYPFILLNLLFSALAAYAAPLILVSQTRQAERDRSQAELDTRRHDQILAEQERLMRHDAEQTRQIARLLAENRRQTETIADLLGQTRTLVERDGERAETLVVRAGEIIELVRDSRSAIGEVQATISACQERPLSMD